MNERKERWGYADLVRHLQSHGHGTRVKRKATWIESGSNLDRNRIEVQRQGNGPRREDNGRASNGNGRATGVRGSRGRGAEKTGISSVRVR